MTMPASPVAIRDIASARAALGIDPVSSATRRAVVRAPPSMPPAARSPSIAVIERWCCWASTSVGASSAAWPPESTTRSMARSATTVLPEPTSPWSSRFIGWRLREVGLDHLADLPLPVGERERQPLVERRQQAAAARAGLRAERAQERPPPGEHDLGDQRLLEAVAPAADLDLGEGVRRVDQVDGRARVDDVVLVADVVGDAPRARRRRPSGRS